MAAYVGKHANLRDKLLYVEWGVANHNDRLYGKISCYFSTPLKRAEAVKTEREKSIRAAGTERGRQKSVCVFKRSARYPERRSRAVFQKEAHRRNAGIS